MYVPIKELDILIAQRLPRKKRRIGTQEYNSVESKTQPPKHHAVIVRFVNRNLINQILFGKNSSYKYFIISN